jgi:hypothetical protein
MSTLESGLDASPPEPRLIPNSVRARIGTVFRRVTGRVPRQDFQRWAAAVGDYNPLYSTTRSFGTWDTAKRSLPSFSCRT